MSCFYDVCQSYPDGAEECQRLMNGRLFDSRVLEAEICDISANNVCSDNVYNKDDNSNANVAIISKPPTVTATATMIVKKPEIKASALMKGNGKNTNLPDTETQIDVNKIEEDTDNFLSSLL